MTAPLFLLPPGGLDGAEPGALVTLDGEEGRHAATVRRVRTGERVDLADGAGLVARCRVQALASPSVLLRVDAIERTVPPVPPLVLVQALAKGGRDEQAVETATELGVDAVVPWQAGRSVVVWAGERAERSRRRWEATARAATKQSRRASLPTIHPPVDTPGLAQLVAASALTLVLHEEAQEALATVALPAAAPGAVLVVVGPEGGIAAQELTALGAAGARAVRLGPHVLRSSSAGAAALAVLSLRLHRWG